MSYRSFCSVVLKNDASEPEINSPQQITPKIAPKTRVTSIVQITSDVCPPLLENVDDFFAQSTRDELFDQACSIVTCGANSVSSKVVVGSTDHQQQCMASSDTDLQQQNMANRNSDDLAKATSIIADEVKKNAVFDLPSLSAGDDCDIAAVEDCQEKSILSRSSEQRNLHSTSVTKSNSPRKTTTVYISSGETGESVNIPDYGNTAFVKIEGLSNTEIKDCELSETESDTKTETSETESEKKVIGSTNEVTGNDEIDSTLHGAVNTQLSDNGTKSASSNSNTDDDSSASQSIPSSPCNEISETFGCVTSIEDIEPFQLSSVKNTIMYFEENPEQVSLRAVESDKLSTAEMIADASISSVESEPVIKITKSEILFSLSNINEPIFSKEEFDTSSVSNIIDIDQITKKKCPIPAKRPSKIVSEPNSSQTSGDESLNLVHESQKNEDKLSLINETKIQETECSSSLNSNDLLSENKTNKDVDESLINSSSSKLSENDLVTSPDIIAIETEVHEMIVSPESILFEDENEFSLTVPIVIPPDDFQSPKMAHENFSLQQQDSYVPVTEHLPCVILPSGTVSNDGFEIALLSKETDIVETTISDEKCEISDVEDITMSESLPVSTNSVLGVENNTVLDPSVLTSGEQSPSPASSVAELLPIKIASTLDTVHELDESQVTEIKKSFTSIELKGECS